MPTTNSSRISADPVYLAFNPKTGVIDTRRSKRGLLRTRKNARLEAIAFKRANPGKKAYVLKVIASVEPFTASRQLYTVTPRANS